MVGIIIITYNLSSEIFVLQIQAIKKFCTDEYCIQIVDNSTDEESIEHIRYHSEQLGLNYIKTYAHSANGSDSHTWAANLAYQRFKNDYPYLLFIDHDCIPVIPFSVVGILDGGHVMAGVGQGAKKKYMWAGMVMIANERIDTSIVDFSTNQEFGLDTGGNLYKVIEKYGEDACVFFNESYHQNQYFNGTSYNYYAMLNNAMFMHFINSSLWNPVENNDQRINGLISIAKQMTGL